MTQFKTNQPGTNCTYPGEYIPAPITLQELMAEWQHQHEGESRPLVNVVEIPDVFIIEVAAPSLKSGDFYVSIKDNILSVSVLHKEEEAGKKLYQQHEFNYHCFKREIVLPGNVDADFLSAAYEDGILCIRLPKSKEPVTNYIERVIIY